MKLDKWPEEIECDGWRWELRWTINTQTPAPDGIFYSRPTYHKHKKLHTPPTMREIMEHLLKGGIVRFGEEEPANCYFYKIDQSGELHGKTGGAGDSWSRRRGISDRRDDNSHLWFLEEIAK
jgi:hypothetical protein